MLTVVDLYFDYADKPLLQQVQFCLKSGELLHLRGQNGMGKTTLLKLLAGLLHPTEGEIQYNDLPIADDLPTYQQHLCYVGHKSGVSLALTVQENCRFELQRHQKNLEFDGLLERFGLSGLEHMLCGLLSAGQRRRIGLIRLLMSNASLWLLDEPFVALDQNGIDALTQCLIEHLSRGGQVVLTSHQSLPAALSTYRDYCL